ncbi:hypothetical protein [Demequina pelophila]|uniref:hypothetical protein n=1 Tax=Demequina pelophila TaxID=1638984 RepID=UPI000AB5BA58|nr:hypothetical protein [Demequina pelophila]
MPVVAVEDPRVLATIRADRHAEVLEYLARLAIDDPRDLPPLMLPLLVELPPA